MERSGDCHCGSGKPCSMHQACAKKCDDCKCACKNSHACKECKSCHSEKPKKS